MGHGHIHLSPKEESAVANRSTKIVMVVFLVVVAVLTTIGMVRLWPSHDALHDIRSSGYQMNAPGVTYETAEIRSIESTCANNPTPPDSMGAAAECMHVELMIRTGIDTNETITLDITGPGAEAGLTVGDRIELLRVPADPQLKPTMSADDGYYSYVGVKREAPVTAFVLIFVIAVLAVARLRGLFALIALAIAIAVMALFVLPAIAVGESGVLVGLTGSIAIMFVVIYIAHGFSIRTSAALASTILGLLLSTGLGVAAVKFGRLSGYADDADVTLKAVAPHLDMQELLIAALIIAGLGVLNDVTITQVSAVWELRAAAPAMSRLEIYRAGMRIGRDHIASTIYTIVFAYAGGALATLVTVLLFYDRSVIDLISAEAFGSEVLRTLASATGLVLTVPLTTLIASLGIKPAGTVTSSHSNE